MKKFLAVLSIVLVLVSVFAFAASAADSKSGSLLYKVTVVSYKAGSKTTGDYIENGDTITLTASDSKYTFTGWVIDGKYEIVSGSLKSKTLTVRPLSDLLVEESYNVQGSKGYVNSNNSSKSPKTGNNALAGAVVLTAGAFVVMAASKKRIAA